VSFALLRLFSLASAALSTRLSCQDFQRDAGLPELLLASPDSPDSGDGVRVVQTILIVQEH
jgi:hypothetical protein